MAKDNVINSLVFGFLGFFRQLFTTAGQISGLGLIIAIVLGLFKVQIPTIPGVDLTLMLIGLFFAIPLFSFIMINRQQTNFYDVYFVFARFGHLAAIYGLMWVALNIIMIQNLSYLELLHLSLVAYIIQTFILIVFYKATFVRGV